MACSIEDCEGRAFIAGDEYTIADMACYPWVVPWKKQLQNLDDFPHLRRWFEAIRERPGTIRAYEKGKPWSERPVVNDDSRGILFGQKACRFMMIQSPQGGGADAA